MRERKRRSRGTEWEREEGKESRRERAGRCKKENLRE